jgi:hypothetical protein
MVVFFILRVICLNYDKCFTHTVSFFIAAHLGRLRTRFDGCPTVGRPHGRPARARIGGRLARVITCIYPC